jgi:hypothetical protein
MALNQAELKELLRYDPETGLFFWKSNRSSLVRKGDKAGTRNKKTGYITITITRKHYLAHRLAWLYTEGYFPEYGVDHINGNTSDNRRANLRHVTQFCNMQNASMSKKNKSGYKGVFYSKSKKKWLSQITIRKKQISIGQFDDPFEAALARIAVEDCHPHWHCDERCENRKKVLACLRR